MKNNRIHFVGIGGSGISGIAVLAEKNGYKVSGCDLEESTSYLDPIRKSETELLVGHDKSHVNNADLVVVSPAILYANGNHPEVLAAKKNKKLITWQEFLGKYLHNDKEVLCVSGTHGKSTTTAMLGRIFEDANLNPSITLGATVKEWKSNFRYGLGDYFITEADEFNDNFLHYNPSAIILNNVEMDHPDYFKNESQIFNSFSKFIQRLKEKKILIVNQDSLGVKKTLELIGKRRLDKLSVYGYSLTDKPLAKINNSVKIVIQKSDNLGTKFLLVSNSLNFHNSYKVTIPGEFNVSNATGAIILSKLYEISDEVVAETLNNFRGIGRRLEFLGQSGGVRVYDDYAHHPTAIKATLSGLRQIYPKNRVWAINEPHSFSRTKELLNEYEGVFDEADKVIITPIYKARDKGNFGITEEMLAKATAHKDIAALKSFQEIVESISKEVEEGDIILVMGAGKSYILAKAILTKLPK